jgi:peptidoglycan/xylan/chitin deacetylase (PgdA/CDA1 family)
MTTRRAGIAIVYHRIGARQGDPRSELMPATDRDRFDKQLRHLKRHYHLVPVEAFPRVVARRSWGQRFPVCLTFDDDLREHVEYVMPALRDHRIPATFFLGGEAAGGPWPSRLQRAYDRGCTAREIAELLPQGSYLARDPDALDIHAVGVAIRRLPPADRDEVSKRLLRLAGPDTDAGLSDADIAKLASAGFQIGFHTRCHYALPTLTDPELEIALHDGRERLASLSGQTIDTIAYPHGRADRRVVAAALRAGYRLGFTTEWQATTPESDPMEIGRLEPSDPSLGRFSLKIARALLGKRQIREQEVG